MTGKLLDANVQNYIQDLHDLEVLQQMKPLTSVHLLENCFWGHNKRKVPADFRYCIRRIMDSFGFSWLA